MTLILPCIWFFLLGTALGSFFNVVIDRLPEGRDFVFTRSSCSDCGTVLKWYDMVPVFSYLLIGGKCRYCGAKLSPWYLVSEIIVGLLSMSAFLLYSVTGNLTALIGNLMLWFLLFIVAVMDLKTSYIMDIFPILIAVGGIVISLINKRSPLDILLGGAVGFLSFGILYLGSLLILKQEGMGLGDVFLLGAIGCWMSWTQILITTFLTAYVSLIFILCKTIKDKKIAMKTEFPLGPSICIAALIMSLYGPRIQNFLLGVLLP